MTLVRNLGHVGHLYVGSGGPEPHDREPGIRIAKGEEDVCEEAKAQAKGSFWREKAEVDGKE